MLFLIPGDVSLLSKIETNCSNTTKENCMKLSMSYLSSTVMYGNVSTAFYVK